MLCKRLLVQISWQRGTFAGCHTGLHPRLGLRASHSIDAERLRRRITRYRDNSLAKSHSIKDKTLPPDPDIVAKIKTSRESAIEVLSESIARDTATVASISVCLAAYLEGFDRKPFKQSVRDIRIDKPGQKILMWLWNDTRRLHRSHAFDSFTTPQLFGQLCYCLVAEDAEEFIWKWLDINGSA